MNACPAVYVFVSQLLPSDVYTVSEPCWTTTNAPHGCECQPEEPPGLTVICATATSDPAFSGMVPSVVLVPRANGTFVSPDGGVAPLGATVIAMTTPASPTLTNAHLTDRFMTSPFRTCRSGPVVPSGPGTSLSAAGGRRPPPAVLLTARCEVANRSSWLHRTPTPSAPA